MTEGVRALEDLFSEVSVDLFAERHPINTGRNLGFASALKILQTTAVKVALLSFDVAHLADCELSTFGVGFHTFANLFFEIHMDVGHLEVDPVREHTISQGDLCVPFATVLADVFGDLLFDL